VACVFSAASLIQLVDEFLSFFVKNMLIIFSPKNEKVCKQKKFVQINILYSNISDLQKKMLGCDWMKCTTNDVIVSVQVVQH